MDRDSDTISGARLKAARREDGSLWVLGCGAFGYVRLSESPTLRVEVEGKRRCTGLPFTFMRMPVSVAGQESVSNVREGMKTHHVNELIRYPCSTGPEEVLLFYL